MRKDLTISLIQSDLYWEDIDANLAMFEEKIWELDRKSDLIVLPEMFTTGFTMRTRGLSELMNGKTFRWMKQQAAQSRAVVTGSCIIAEKGSFFNRLFVVFPDGSYHTYDKRHLFILTGEQEVYTGGTERLIVEIKGWRVMPMICYDLRFPVWSRSLRTSSRLHEYDLLLYVANWPAPRIQAWDILLRARAVENIAYCAGVNRTGQDGTKAEYPGHSTILDFKGNILAYSEKEEALTLVLSDEALSQFREKCPFQKSADEFKIIGPDNS